MNATSTVLLLGLLGAPPAASTDPLCARREPCRVVETRDAGQDEQGRPLRVKRLSLGWTDLETGARFTGSRFGPGGRKAKGAAARGLCEATEWWLSRPDKPAQLLLSKCDDGQGAVREEKVDVGDNRVGYTRRGVRRREQWTTTLGLQLAPLRLLSEYHETRWVSPSTKEKKEEISFWDSETLSGEVGRAPSECQPGESSLGKRNLKYLPRVQVDEAYLAGGWKQTALGECHLEATSFLLGGDKVTVTGDIGLRALLVAEDTLILEVEDDTWTGPSDKPLNDDHVELWLAPELPQQLTSCGEPTEAQLPVQWDIRIADGQVLPGFGTPKEKLQVERVSLPDGTGYRLKVTLHTPFRGISVVYSDSDSAKKPETRVATSQLVLGRPETLNPVRTVFAEEATCVVKDGKLSIKWPELEAEPEKAVLQRE
jgi:hypothetical protein